jgi:hypothetical protein
MVLPMTTDTELTLVMTSLGKLQKKMATPHMKIFVDYNLDLPIGLIDK